MRQKKFSLKHSQVGTGWVGQTQKGSGSTGDPNQTNGRSPPGDHAPCKGSSAGQGHVRRGCPCAVQPEGVCLGAQLLPGATKKKAGRYIFTSDIHRRYPPDSAS